MQTNTVQTLIEYVKDLSGQDNASDAKIVRALNFAVDTYTYIGLTSSGIWQWDSRTQGDTSRVTATLTTEGKVSLEDELVTIEHFEILIDGKYQTITPTDQRNEHNPLSTIYDSTGKPKYYDASGRFLRVYPTPDQSYTVRLTFGRRHQRFSTDNLTAAVGVEPIHEEYIALYAADRIMLGTNDPSRTQIRNELQVKEAEIRDLFSKRDQDTGRKLKARIPTAFMSRSRGKR